MVNTCNHQLRAVMGGRNLSRTIISLSKWVHNTPKNMVIAILGYRTSFVLLLKIKAKNINASP